MTTHIVMMPDEGQEPTVYVSKLSGRRFNSCVEVFKDIKKAGIDDTEVVILPVSEFTLLANKGELPIGLSDCYLANIQIIGA